MKLGKLILGAAILFSITAKAQDEVERTECNRYKAIAGNAYAAKNYQKAATSYIRAEKECDVLEKAFYSPMIYAIGRVVDESEGEKQIAYIDTIISVIENAQNAYGENITWTKRLSAYYLRSSRADKLQMADTTFTFILKNHKEEVSDLIIQHHYANLYNLWAASKDEVKKNYAKRIIEEYFTLSTIINEKGLSPKTLEFLTAYLDIIARDCDALLPEINGFMTSLPQDKELKKSTVNNFIQLLEKKGCTDSKEYAALIDTVIVLDPNSVETSLKKAKLLDIKGKTSAAISAYKDVIGLTQDPEVISDAELSIAQAYYRSRSYKAAHNAGLAVSGKNSAEGAKIAANSVMASINDCGNTIFERKANNYYAVQLAKKYGFSSSSYEAACPSSEDVFNASKKFGESVELPCWGKTVTITKF